MVVKRRYIIWLIRAYIKRWGKIIIFYFFLGLAIFFLLLFAASYILPRLPIGKKEVIGVVGSYTIDSIPEYIFQDVSHGLTKIDTTGIPRPDLASSWGIENDGKQYTIRLRSNRYFSDGEKLTSKSVPFSFSDVTIQRPDHQTIIFRLKDSYAPFLIALSHPVFKKGFVGIGDYVLRDIRLNGDFVESLTMTSVKDQSKIKTYEFYPTIDALKIAFALGEITRADGLPDIAFKNTSFNHFPNAVLQKHTDYTELVTLFYNTGDKNLSDKKLRDALAYSLPDSFPFGERAYSPYSPKSWVFIPDNSHVQDIEHTKLLLQAAGYTDKNPPEFTLTTSAQYQSVATLILKNWSEAGIKVHVRIMHTIPSDFQIYLANFHVPIDPDQYTLWHSDQVNNITNYKNLRIDKLLEDGRKTIDQDKRIKIYANFQKYLLDDQPASFLYFPYSYTVVRK